MINYYFNQDFISTVDKYLDPLVKVWGLNSLLNNTFTYSCTFIYRFSGFYSNINAN